MANITFLEQESLNEDLSKFLMQNDFSDGEVNLALNHKRMNVTESDSHSATKLTNKAIDYINEYESLYLKVLKSMNIMYQNPYQKINKLI